MTGPVTYPSKPRPNRRAAMAPQHDRLRSNPIGGSRCNRAALPLPRDAVGSSGKSGIPAPKELAVLEALLRVSPATLSAEARLEQGRGVTFRLRSASSYCSNVAPHAPAPARLPLFAQRSHPTVVAQ